MKKDLLDSFINPEDRLIKAAKKDLEYLKNISIVSYLIKGLNTKESLLKISLNSIIKNSKFIIEKKTFLIFSSKEDFLKHCKNTYGVMQDLGISIEDNILKNNNVKNKKFNNIKLKDGWFNIWKTKDQE